ncbi:anaerobic sulfatase maturase [Lentibacter sp. XHP0401]|uniref:anaerobic sulfatase maturase n=1 Tax=Lentibacter sp. XHP0401 TaxID=2984334 RepID=UPI0021E88CFD|nr:anaerobic sulfatase maturase [Lentibacter sp. XHP0401]MCV2892858.1 anaerobic sulfatase maturase [Lentibacter sp. XHP0401]
MTPLPFNIMTKPIGPRCNIDCKYCYYLEKEKLYPDEKKFRMSDEVLERYIRETIDASLEAGVSEIHFAWQGGEPTMLGIAYFRKIVDLQKKHTPFGAGVTNSLQTNAMLLDDEWGHFLADNRFLVGISIDGPKQIHDRYRVDRAGRPTFDAVIRGLEVLQRQGVAHNALTTVHRANGGKGKDIYRFLKGLGFDHMQFIPIVERIGATGLAGAPQIEGDPAINVTDWSVAPRVYGKFLCDVFDLWFKTDVGKLSVQFFDVQLGLWAGRPSSLCVFAETCGNSLALEHDGSLYSCDHYVYPEYKLGNIKETPMRDMLWSDRQVEFGQDKQAALTAQCRACEFRFACNGGCPKHRFSSARNGETGHNYFCESYTAFFKHAGARLQKMAWQLNNGIPVTGAPPKA